jgi:acetyltransferase-like isoleucine patch superfamily enzyme
MIFYWISDLLSPSAYDVHWGSKQSSRVFWRLKRKFLIRIGMNVGKGTCIGEGFRWIMGQETNISFGNHTAIGYNMHCYAFDKISIGDFTMLSHDIILANGGHAIDNFEPFSAPLDIGKGCWVGVGARIIVKDKNGLTIGNNSIVGAGSLVINDIPANAVAVGVPAKIVKYRELPEKSWHFGNYWFHPQEFNLIDRKP